MNDQVQNKIVEQKDILKIIDILNEFYKEKMAVFNKTQADIDNEDTEYNDWNNKRMNSDNYFDFPKFEYKTHKNKLTHESFTFSFYCIDGLSYEDKTYQEAQTIMATGYSSFERMTIRLDLSWNKNYKYDDYSYSGSNNSNLSAYINIYEDNINMNFSSKDADGDMKYLKSEISDVFDNLKPKYSDIISKRESIKYCSTLWISFIISTIIILSLTLVLNKINIDTGSGILLILAYFILVIFLNMMIPSTKINNLYKLIIPPKKTVYEGREIRKVDNIKEFKSTSEVHIGRNALKSGKREQIAEISKRSKIKNGVFFIISIVIILIFCVFI